MSVVGRLNRSRSRSPKSPSAKHSNEYKNPWCQTEPWQHVKPQVTFSQMAKKQYCTYNIEHICICNIHILLYIHSNYIYFCLYVWIVIYIQLLFRNYSDKIWQNSGCNDTEFSTFLLWSFHNHIWMWNKTTYFPEPFIKVECDWGKYIKSWIYWCWRQI